MASLPSHQLPTKTARKTDFIADHLDPKLDEHNARFGFYLESESKWMKIKEREQPEELALIRRST